MTQVSDLDFHQSVHRLRRVDSGQRNTDNTEMHRLVFTFPLRAGDFQFTDSLTRAKLGFIAPYGADFKGFCEQARLVDMANYYKNNMQPPSEAGRFASKIS